MPLLLILDNLAYNGEIVQRFIDRSCLAIVTTTLGYPRDVKGSGQQVPPEQI